jgi:hypothetical protein
VRTNLNKEARRLIGSKGHYLMATVWRTVVVRRRIAISVAFSSSLTSLLDQHQTRNWSARPLPSEISNYSTLCASARYPISRRVKV